MKAQKPDYKRILPPAGNHVARMINIIYLGTQHSEQFGDNFRLRLTWELPNERAVFQESEGEKPFVVSKETSLSMGKKSALRPIVEGVIGVALTDEEAYAFDVDDLLGKESMLYVTIDETEGGKYAKVNSVSPLPKGLNCPVAFNAPKILSFEKWNEEYFESLPDFIKEKIVKSKEYKALKGLPVDKSIDPNEIPF